jgi:peroxiredoxin
MRTRVITAGASVFGIFLLALVSAAPGESRLDIFGPPRLSPFQKEYEPIGRRVMTNLVLRGLSDKEHFTNDLAAIAAVVDRYKRESPEETAEVQFQIAMMHFRVFDEPARAIELLGAVKREYPETKATRKVDVEIETIPKLVAGWKTERTLKPGAELPDFEVKDMEGKPMSLKQYRGKVLLVAFWVVPGAGWQFSKIKALHAKYQPKGFEIIGINMDEDEKSVRHYATTNNLAWPNYFDGKGWRNEIALKYGVGSYCSSFLLSRQGKIVLKDFISMDDLESAIVKTLKEP